MKDLEIEPLMNADEVASVLRVDRKRVYELHRLGLLPGVRLGPRQLRFRRPDVRHLAERGTSQSGATSGADVLPIVRHS